MIDRADNMGVVLTIEQDNGAQLDYVFNVSSMLQAHELIGEALSLGAAVVCVRIA